jgi:hypothetical protein
LGESHYTYKFIDKNCTSDGVDIINKTLDTTAIVKNSDTDITYRTICILILTVILRKLGTSIIFGKSRSIRHRFFTLRIKQKFKNSAVQQPSALQGEQNASRI